MSRPGPRLYFGGMTTLQSRACAVFPCRPTSVGRRADAVSNALPHLVNEEFEAYLNYGRLEYEILRVKCDACRHEKKVARLRVPVGATPARYPPSRP